MRQRTMVTNVSVEFKDGSVWESEAGKRYSMSGDKNLTCLMDEDGVHACMFMHHAMSMISCDICAKEVKK